MGQNYSLFLTVIPTYNEPMPSALCVGILVPRQKWEWVFHWRYVNQLQMSAQMNYKTITKWEFPVGKVKCHEA